MEAEFNRIEQHHMTQATALSKRLFYALTCMALVFWSVMPSYTHAPTVYETINEHREMVETHGHPHGFEETLYWAMHGHSHDVTDHDHSQAFVMPSRELEPSAEFSALWLRMASLDGPSRQFPIDRPPRS